MLDSHVANFRKADLRTRLSIIKECEEWIQSRWESDAQFNKKLFHTVCAFTITLGLSNIFVACSQVSV
jgi:hypothetical protein